MSKVKEIREKALADIQSAKEEKVLRDLEVAYLGRKGELTQVLRSLKNKSLGERKKIGSAANELRKELETVFKTRSEELKKQAKQSITDTDLTKPGIPLLRGHLHPLTLIEREIREIFSSMNFSVVEGPEVESEYYNFDALNIPASHPARDMWDTFWLKEPSQKSKVKSEKLLLRTHTSPMQVRYMETHKPPFQIIVPGRVFRYEATDSSHEINFYQLEGLMVGKDITLSNFRFVIEEFFRSFFPNQKIQFRFRPSYFPFVEPGLEVDIKLGNRWLEVMGAGMVHPKVFQGVKYKNVQGFAFGVGIDRLAMIKYGIPDVRMFYSGDLRFIRQF